MKSCRNCVHSQQNAWGELRCPIAQSPAYRNIWAGLCARASRSTNENARYDARCEKLAGECPHYRQEG